MAEQEVIKHTRRAFGVWRTRKKFWHKVGELLLEIFIIVFAVSLSIYFHDRSELRHQRHDAKEFLLGLKQDLLTDIEEMKQDKESYGMQNKVFTYIISRKLNESLNVDTIQKYSSWMLNLTGLVPNNGRFEGFKSSGKIGTIENKELQNNIMDLYQENIPNLINSTNFYISKKQRFFDYIEVNRRRLTDSTNDLPAILTSNQAYNICEPLTFVDQILRRYDSCINKMNLIIKDIDKEYKH